MWLADYAEDKLKKAGLRPDAAPRQGSVHERGSTLVLTLRAWRVAQCPGKLLYLKGLVLYEDAVRVREPKT